MKELRYLDLRREGRAHLEEKAKWKQIAKWAKSYYRFNR
jgi:hypothetical protein